MMPVPLPLAAAGGVPDYLSATAAVVLAAAVIGYLSARVRVLPIVGFLLAGVVIGPNQLGLVPTGEAVDAAAELGVILLLFTIGIEFSLERLARVWRWIVLGGGAQVLLATAAGVGVVAMIGGDWRAGLFTGFLVALSSTAIVLKLLADTGRTGTTRGRLALSTLIFQDLAVVAMVLVVPLLGADASGGAGPLLRALAIALGVIGLVLVVARRVMPPALERVAALCSPEVFLLTVIAICFGTAYLTALAGVSVSLGAFLAGLVVSESRHSTHAFAEVLPLQIIFSAVFFVSVGMLLDVGFLVRNLPLVLGAAVGVLVIKTLTTTAALLPLRVGWRDALASGLLLGQVGEFSFVLLTVGEGVGLTPLGRGEEGSQVFVATTVLLMVATPALAALGDRLPSGRDHRGGAGSSADSPAGDAAMTPEEAERSGHVVLLGWGPDSVDLARDLRARGTEVVMTTLNPGGAGEAEALGVPVVRGDSMREHVLQEAGIEAARLVVVAEDDHEKAAQVASVVRRLTTAPVVVRAHDGLDLESLAEAGVDHVVDPGAAGRQRLRRTVLEQVGVPIVAPPGAGAGTDTGSWADTTRLVHYRWPAADGCPHGTSSRPVLPRSDGCVECQRQGQNWVHLRICLECGNVGCCDSSPGRHARSHHHESSHPLITSAEAGEEWGYCFLDSTTVQGPSPRPGG